MSNFTVVLDANVLHAYPLASVLLELAEARMYRACWSAEIHAEWMRSVQRARPGIPLEKLERRRDAMDTALPDARISGHECLVACLELPDPDDRHVLAVAIRAKAQVIVTYNESDFPAATLAGFDLVAQHPDTFLRHLIDLERNVVRARLEMMLARLVNPPIGKDEYIAALERLSLPETAAALRELLADG